MRQRLKCMSKTRQSGYTKECNGRGILCKNGNIRCKSHGGRSSGPRNKTNSIQNILNYNAKRNSLNNGIKNSDSQTVDGRQAIDQDLPGQADAKSI